MARRSIGWRVAGLATGVFGVALILLAFVIMLVRTYPLEATAVALLGAGSWWFLKQRSASRRQREQATARAGARVQVRRSPDLEAPAHANFLFPAVDPR